MVYNSLVYANLNVHKFKNCLVISFVFPQKSGYFCIIINNYPRQLLLFLNNAPGHPPNTGKMTVDVKVDYVTKYQLMYDFRGSEEVPEIA